MKLKAPSTDLLIKLALVAGGLGLAWYLLNKAQIRAREAIAGAGQALGEVADSVIAGVNPVNPENIFYRGVNAFGGAVVSDTGPGRSADGSWSVGAWAYDVTHANPFESFERPLPTQPDSYYNMYP